MHGLTFYGTSQCKIQLLTLQYRVEKAALNSFILNIEWMATYWVQAVPAPNMYNMLHFAGTPRYRRIKPLCLNAHSNRVCN